MAERRFLGWVLVKANGDPRQRLPDLFTKDPADKTMQHLLEFHDKGHPGDAPHRWDCAFAAGVNAPDGAQHG